MSIVNDERIAAIRGRLVERVEWRFTFDSHAPTDIADLLAAVEILDEKLRGANARAEAAEAKSARLTASALRERLRNAVAGCKVEAGSCTDNLSIVLVSYFEDHHECPDEEPDDNGWQPWASEKTDAAIELLLDAVEAEKST